MTEEMKDELRSLERVEESLDTPLIPQVVYDNLPSILKVGCENFSDLRERDIFFIGALVLVSGALPNVYGYYANRKVYLNLYAMVVAPPASGKGTLMHARKYVEKIEKSFRDSYLEQMESYAQQKNKKEEQREKKKDADAKKPVRKRMIIPANSSAAAFMLQLQQSDGEGTIFETEADTLASTSKQEWGNSSDIYRKALQHEPVTCSRRDIEMDIEILEPKLSMLLSGTFDQVQHMGLDNPVNGLQSRYLFYIFESIPHFKTVSPNTKFKRHSFDDLGDEMLSIYRFLRHQNIEIELSDSQWHKLESYFKNKMSKTVRKYNTYVSSMIIRLGLSAFRIISIIATLRAFEGGLPSDTITCNPQDFKTALLIIDTFFEHNIAVFSNSKRSGNDPILSKYFDFVELLPSDREFSRHEAIDLSNHLFSAPTIDRRLKKLKKNGLLVSPKPGYYKKVKK